MIPPLLKPQPLPPPPPPPPSQMHSHIDPAAIRKLAYQGTKLAPPPHFSTTPPSGFSESSSASYSSSFASSSQHLDERSRPSTSSGPAAINRGMQALMSPTITHRPHPLHQTTTTTSPPQGVWPIVIQLEEAPQDESDQPRTDLDTFDTRMLRIQSWRNSSSAVTSSQRSAPLKRSGSGNETQTKRTKTVTHYRCTACDTSYSSRQSLKRHAQGVRTNPACRTAVEYFLE